MKPYYIFAKDPIELQFDLTKDNVKITLNNNITNIEYSKFKRELSDLIKHLERVDHAVIKK